MIDFIELTQAVPWGIIFILPLLLLCWNYTRPQNGGGKYRIPGSYGLPVFGEVFHLVEGIDVFTKKRRKKYGPIFKSNFVGDKIVFVMGAHLAKQIYKAESSKCLESRFSPAMAKAFGKYAPLNVNGKHWKVQRAVALKSFQNDSLQAYFPVLLDMYNEYLDKWSNSKGKIIDFAYEMSTFAHKVNVKFLFGNNFSEQELDQLHQLMRTWSGAFSSVPIDLPGLGYRIGINAREKIADFFEKEIIRRRSCKDYNEGQRVDLLQHIITSTNPDTGRPYEMEQLRTMVPGYMFGSLDTTLSNIIGMIVSLEQRGDFLEKIKTEIKTGLAVPSEDAAGTMSSLKSSQFDVLLNSSQYPLLNAYVDEVIRTVQTAPWSQRYAIETFDVQTESGEAYTIQKGNYVIIGVSETGNMAPYDCPQKFDPYRWLEPRNEGEKVSKFSRLEFGEGIRKCAGSRFARVQLVYLLAVLALRNSRIGFQSPPIKIYKPTAHWTNCKGTFSCT